MVRVEVRAERAEVEEERWTSRGEEAEVEEGGEVAE